VHRKQDFIADLLRTKHTDDYEINAEAVDDSYFQLGGNTLVLL